MQHEAEKPQVLRLTTAGGGNETAEGRSHGHLPRNEGEEQQEEVELNWWMLLLLVSVADGTETRAAAEGRLATIFPPQRQLGDSQRSRNRQADNSILQISIPLSNIVFLYSIFSLDLRKRIKIVKIYLYKYQYLSQILIFGFNEFFLHMTQILISHFCVHLLLLKT